VNNMKNITSPNLKISHLSFCVLAALSSPVVHSAEKASAEKEIERISVTGSNIKRAIDVGALPITSLSEQILRMLVR